MSKNNFGIKSTFDAFVALNEILEEEKPSLKKKLKNKNLKEGVSVDLRSNDELEAAKKLRAEKKDDTTLEVIDVDADAVDQIQNNDSYVGKMLLQCVSCKATRFMDIDDLKQDENDKDLYNLEDECPHCHHKGSGYSLVGQVGKTPDQEEEEPALDNDEASTEEAVFDNTEDVENEEAEEETPEETPTEEKPEEDEEEKDFTETDSEDDTNDLDLADLGDEFNVDDIVADDTEDEDEEDKTKKESLQEDKSSDTDYFIQALKELYKEDCAETGDNEYDCDWGTAAYEACVETLKEECGYFDDRFDNLTHTIVDKIDEMVEKHYTYKQIIDTLISEASHESLGENLAQELTEDENAGKFSVDSKNDFDIELPKYVVLTDNGAYDLEQKGKSGHYVWIGFQHGHGFGLARMRKSMLELADKISDIYKEKYGNEAKVDDFTKSSDMYRVWVETNNDIQEGLEEDLDMATFEGSIANLIDTFTIEDHPVNVKLLNKNGSELGIYSSDDLPFTIKSQMMDTFNTDDNFLELNVTEEGEGTTVNDLFNYYRPDEDNQTTFLVTDIDTEEEDEYEELSELLENYGDYYIDGALGLRTLNIYIADGDLETEVEPLDDEEIEELGKENAEKENVTDESLVEEIIKSYPRLKLSRVNNPLSEEYFIAESIRLNEDLDLVYNNFVKHSNDKKLIEHFKSYTGYEDEVDKFLKEHNISKEKYNKMLNESADKTYTINGTDYILYKDSYGNYKLDDKKTRERVADWDSYDEAMADIKKWIKANKITDATDEMNESVSEDKIKAKIANIDKQIKELQKREKEIDNDKSYDTMIDHRSGAPVGKERKATDLAHNCGQIKALKAQKKELEDLLKENVQSKEKYNKIIKEEAGLITLFVYDKNGEELQRIGSDPKEALDYLKNNKNASYITYTTNPNGSERDYAFKNTDGTIKIHIYINSKDEYDYVYKLNSNAEGVNEKLFASVKNRAQLGEAINKLVKANEKYRISKSVTEGYRYDIFVSKNCKLNEAVNDDLVRKVVADANDEYNRYKNETNEPLEYFIGQSADSFGVPFDKWHVFLPDHISEEDEEFKAFKRGYEDNHGPLDEGLFDLASSNDSNVDEIDAEVVDRETPEATTTQLVPEGMSEEDIEIVNKIDRIAGDICDAIEEVYNIPAREKKPYVAADIIRDLQLVGGEVLADDLEDTPWDNLTREMYNQFNGFYDSLDDLVSFVTGQRVTTSQAERLRQAIASLDGPHFTTEAIRANIASPRFLEAVRRGYVPYVSPQEISTNGNNRNNRNRFLEQCDDEITEDVNPKLVDMDGDVEDPNFNLASFAKTTVTESAKDFQEFGNAEDVEKRLDELEYLKTQRELNDEEQEEYEYCLQLLGKEYEKEEYPIDLEEFDSGINEYFADSDDVLGYTSKKIRKDGNDFIVEGLVENWDTSKPVTFIIKKNEGKDNYTVSNDLFEDKFTLDL